MAGKTIPKFSRPARGRPPLSEADRKRILNATVSVFLENGFARAGTNEIARRAHTSKQTLYAIFPSKDDLFAGVVSAHTEKLFARHTYYIASARSPRRDLNDIGLMVLDLFANAEFLALYRIVVAEAHRFPRLARQLWQQTSGRGYGLLADYLRSRRIGGPNYRQAAARFVALVLGDFLLNALLNPDLVWGPRARRLRVHRAVEDFLSIFSPEGIR